MLERLDWDSQFFGFTVARVVAPAMSDAEAQSIAASADAIGARCIYFLSDDSASWRSAAAAGFDPIDIRVQLTRTGAIADAQRTLGTRADADEVVDIVREGAFRQSRFFQDPRFPRDKSAELFEIWARRGLRESDWFTVREPGGFVTCGPSSIQLVAVAEKARGRGLGQSLVAGALAEFAARGVREITVVTQGANLNAQRLYVHAGFRPTACALWLHRWRDV